MIYIVHASLETHKGFFCKLSGGLVDMVELGLSDQAHHNIIYLYIKLLTNLSFWLHLDGRI